MRAGTFTPANVTQTATGYLELANGTTSQRPVPAANGMVRYNDTYNMVEAFIANSWANVSTVSGFYIQQIKGFDNATSEPMMFVTDTTRSKTLSVNEMTLLYQMNSLNNGDWILPNNSLTSTNGYVMPYDGTVVRMTLNVASQSGATKVIDVYVGSTATAGLTTTTTGTSFVNSAVNIDFTAGSLLRFQAVNGGSGSTSNLQDITLTVSVKWRNN